MPIREKRTESIAGLFIIIGIVMLGGLFAKFGRFNEKLSDCYELSVEFSNTEGIIEDSEVRLRGTKIGSVITKPRLNMRGNDSVVITQVGIREDIRIPKNSQIRVGSSGFIGDKYLEVIPPNDPSDDYYLPGETMVGSSSGGFETLQADAEQIAEEAKTLLKEASVIAEKLNNGLDSINAISTKIDTTVTRVNEDFVTKENANSLSNIMTNFEDSSKNMKTASDQLQPILAEIKPALAELRPAIADARASIASVKQSTERALSDVPKAIKSIDNAATKASKAMDSLQNENSILGALTKDPEAGNNAKDFLKNIKRYGILRYRDDDAPETSDPRNKFRGSRR